MLSSRKGVPFYKQIPFSPQESNSNLVSNVMDIILCLKPSSNPTNLDISDPISLNSSHMSQHLKEIYTS